MLSVFICSVSHASPHCGYCKSSLEATSTREHRKKITAAAESLFMDCLLPLLLCAQNWYSPHFSCSSHRVSHTSTPGCCLWTVSLSCPHNLLISLIRAISYSYFYGGHRNLNSQRRKSFYTTLESWKADSGCNSALFFSFLGCFFFSSLCCSTLDPAASNRNGATTTIWCLCKDLIWHLHTSTVISLL